MKKTFIPKNYRPSVPGSRLANASRNFDFSPPQSIDNEFIVILSSREDIVPKKFLELIKNEVSSEKLIHLFYEDLGLLWDFSFFQDELKFSLGEYKIAPSSIYNRHPGIQKNMPHVEKHIALLQALDLWDGMSIGQKGEHFHNSSKIYQYVTTLRNACSKINGKLNLPKSYFIKGKQDYFIANNKKALIVKSASSIRSKVVDHTTFSSWDSSAINHLPTLFQEKIEGFDVRIHSCNSILNALQVQNKDTVDYRYSTKGKISYKEIPMERHLAEFCAHVSKFENNPFIGVDFIINKKTIYCLESNPGPGWSTYKHPSIKRFATQMFNLLNNGEKNV